MKKILLLIIGFITTSGKTQNEMKTFESENGFYKLEYPKYFNSKYEDNILNIFPPDNKSSLTVSSYHFENGVDNNRFLKMFELFTENYEPEGELIKLNNDILIQRFFEKTESEKIIWTICLNRNDKVLLVISINFEEAEKDEIIDEYQKVLGSIVNLGVN